MPAACLPPRYPWLFRLLVQSLEQKLGSRARRGRVLAGNQLAVLDRVNAPVLDLGEDGAEAHQLVLDEEGDKLRQAHRFFLAIGETGHVLAVDERLAFRSLDMAQHAGGVADQGDVLAGGEEGFDQLDRVLVFREVPHRTMAAWIEDSVVVFLFYAIEAQGLVELGFGIGVLLEATGDDGLKAGVLALGIERRAAALR